MSCYDEGERSQMTDQIHPGQRISWMSFLGQRVHGHVVKARADGLFKVRSDSGMVSTVPGRRITKECR